MSLGARCMQVAASWTFTLYRIALIQHFTRLTVEWTRIRKHGLHHASLMRLNQDQWVANAPLCNVHAFSITPGWGKKKKKKEKSKDFNQRQHRLANV